MITHRWIGKGGVEFDLTARDKGVGIGAGIEGLASMKATESVRRTPAGTGQRLLGISEDPRPVFWPIVLSESTEDEWFANQAAFFDSLDRTTPGQWIVTAPDDSFRTLQCRFVEESPSYAHDPSERGLEVRGITMVSDFPWWQGEPISQTFQTAGDALPFFAPSGDSHVFNIGSSNTVATASISNPGQEPAWPVWTITGPASAFSVGVESSVVAGDITLLTGETLTIDSHLTRQLIRKIVGSTVTLVPWSTLDSVEFAVVPPGESVDLAVELNGAGSVEVELIPLYERAW